MPSQIPDVDFGEETVVGGESLSTLEKKYSAQMRQIVTQKIDLPISTLPQMIKEQIDLKPEFQRRDRWHLEKRSRFIESLIMNVPIPPVFLGEDEYGNYVVLDGRQRLTALHDFLSNKYALKGLEVWTELNNCQFFDLEKRKLDKTITRRFIPAMIILKESSPEVKYDVFDRLNTGGVVANEMEIRNAVFFGGFNRNLHTLSDKTAFRRLWNIPLDPNAREESLLYNRMADLELVLRFFALREYDKMVLPFKDYLSEFMDSRNKEYNDDAGLEARDAAVFDRSTANCWTVFAEDAFRKPESNRKSVPLADAVMIALSEVEPAKLTPTIITGIQTALKKLCSEDPEFQKAINIGTNGKGAIACRIKAAKKAVAGITAT